MRRANRARWALSFADLTLLLLGFFVFLQASQANRDKALAGLNAYFGAIDAPRQTDLAAERLFAPGEALLSDAGRAALTQAARPLLVGDRLIRIQSIGLPKAENRFDSWDLSAARLGAVARALVAAGARPEHVRIAGLAEQDKITGQTIRLAEGDPSPAK